MFQREKRSGKQTPPKATSEAPLNTAALTREQLALVLTAAGGAVTADQIAGDIAAGAPTSADGTLNFTHYTAWLASQAD